MPADVTENPARLHSAVSLLLQRVVAHPGDLDARLVYADEIGGPRGEAITLHAQLAAAGIAALDDLVFGALAGDELAHRASQYRALVRLHREHAEAWTEDLRVPDLHVTFRAGFAAHVRTGSAGADQLAVLLEREPVTSLTLTIYAPEVVMAYARLPLHRITRLELDGFPEDGLEVAQLLRAMPALTTLVFGRRPGPQHLDGIADHPALVELELKRPTDALIARLASLPIAARLERLAVGGMADSGDTRRDTYDDPLAVFTGCFPAAREIASNWVGVDDAHFERGDLALPPSVQLTAESYTSAAVESLAPALGGVRHLALNDDLDDAACIALATHAPQLERLSFGGRLTAAGLGKLGRLPLRRLVVWAAAKGDPHRLAAALAPLPLESLELRRVPDEVGVAVGRALESPLRALALDHVEVGEAGARAICASQFAAHLRRLRIDTSDAIEAGVAAIAGLPALVELLLDDCGARPVVALAEHSALAALAIERPGPPAVRTALRERFGGEPYREPNLYVFPFRYHRVSKGVLGDALAQFEPQDHGHGWDVAVGDEQVWFSTTGDHKLRPLAAALVADPATAAAVRECATVIRVGFHGVLTPLRPILRALVTAFEGGVVWNAHEDELVEL